MEASAFQILLYYNFVPVPDPEAVVAEQLAWGKELGLRGRILVATEGINGTVSGPVEATREYMARMNAHAIFKTTEFKIDDAAGHAFLKLNVRIKPEIVHFGVEGLEVKPNPGNYVEPEEWREMLKSERDDVVIFDARSSYETEVGRFKGAIDLNLDNFRELPEKTKELDQYRGKKIYTYCTGGIKCEKVAVWLESQGFDEVYQLHGGIIRYGIEAGGEDFEGSCYVFDQRVVVPVNNVNPSVIGSCHICGVPTETMINCANPDCNAHFLVCDNCKTRLEGCCSKECYNSPRRRRFDGRGYYLRGVNSKLYVENPDPNYVRKSD